MPGVNDLLNGYTRPDGTKELSADEKIERGQMAIQALADYRAAKKEGADEAQLAGLLETLKENMPYFGYGYIRDKNELVPPIPLNFYAFRVMVVMGCLLIIFFPVILFFLYRKSR